MAIKTINDYIKDNNVELNKTYTTKQLQDLTWDKKQKQMLTRYAPAKKPKKKNFVMRAMASVDDFFINAGKGFLNTVEGISDTISYGMADVIDFFGADDTADAWRDKIKRDLVNEMFDNKTIKNIEYQSYGGDMYRSIAQGTGNVAAMAGAGRALGFLGSTPKAEAIRTGMVSFSSSYGNTVSQALRNGEDLSTARKAGIINGTAEAISEQFFNGLPGVKGENWGGKFTGKIGSAVEKYFGTKTGKIAMKILDSSGEGLEEIISNVLVSTGNDVAHWLDKNYTYGMENQTGNVFKDAWKSATSKESLDAFISASLTSALTNGGNTILSNVQKNNIIKSYAQENNMSVKEVKESFNQSVQQKADYIQQQQPGMNLGEKIESEQQAKIMTLDELKNDTFVKPGTETEKYQFKESDNQKVNEMNQSLIEANANNTQTTREVAKTAERLIKDLNLEVKFTNNEQIKSQMSENQLKELGDRVINGYVKDGVMYLNIDSNDLSNFTIGHETKHFFEASEELNEALNDSLEKFAREKGVFEKDLEDITKLYTDKDGKVVGDPKAELMANYVGQFFTDYNFVSNLSTKNPSLFARARDFFQKLYYKATGQQEKLMIKQINDNISKVYREYAKTQPGQNISSNETQLLSDKVKTEIKEEIKTKKQEQLNKESKQVIKQETKERQQAKQKEENVLPIAEKVEQKVEEKPKTNKKEFQAIIYSPKTKSPVIANVEGTTTKIEGIDVGIYKDGKNNWHVIDLDSKLSLNTGQESKKTRKAAIESAIKNIQENDIESLRKTQAERYKDIKEDKTLSNKDIQYSLSKDSQGRELTKEQQEYFKDSKVRDENGNLTPLYHGSNAIDTTIFTKDKFGDKGITFLTNDEDIADTYRSKDGKRYEFYANIKNPYIVEGNGKNWNDILVGDNPTAENMYNSLTEQEKTYLTDLAKQMNDMYLGENLGREQSIEGFYQRVNAYDENLYDRLAEDTSIRNKIYDAARYNWNDTYVKDLLGKRKNTNQLVKEAYDSGEYDGVIFKNIVDRGTHYHKPIGRRTSDVYVVFNSNQIKNVDNTNPTDSSDIRYSLSQKEDTDFDELSEKQIEYFKNTKAVDKHGYLETVYHGTPEDFNIFDIEKAGKTGVEFGNGFYFTNSKGTAMAFTEGGLYGDSYDQVKEGYINIEKPASRNSKTISFDEFKNLYNELNNNKNLYDEEMGMSNIDALLSDYGDIYNDKENTIKKFYDSYDNDVTLIDNLSYMANPKEMYEILRNVTGIDGIIIENPTNYDSYEKYYVAFNPDQFKLKSNKNPSESNDMRYLLSKEGELQSEKYNDLYTPKVKNTTRLSDLKRKEVELPTEQENALKTSENEQKENVEKPTRREVIDRNRELARDLLGDITQIKDKKRGISYQINTMKRNLRDIMSKEQAQKMYDTYFKGVTENNAKIENDITSYNEKIQKYNINDKESTYIQMLGELRHNPETTLTKQQVDDFYNKNASKIDQQKCEKAIPEFRQIYDELIERVNDVLTDNGYKPIDYRKGYFPHFIEEKATSRLGKFAEKLGWKVKKGQLPTDIAGITDQFKPGKAWTSFSQQRTGDATDYNALKGLDNYLRGAMDVIHHTNDIQKLRALENEIRYQYSSKGVQDKINEIYADENLDMEEKNDAIANLTSNIRESGLGNFVTEIRNYTDNLANKKAFGDRSMEQTLGRDTYSIMSNINGRVSANMVGANISSAITNFIPITQAWSQIKTKNLMRGMYDTIKSTIKNDNFADKSVFLTNRTKQAERLYNTKLDKVSQKLGIPFEAIDSFTANTIVRGKYYDNIAKGMSEQEAIANADEFAKDVISGRSKGDQPTIFNRKNPLYKLFTAFQLEVNNQYGYMFKDIPVDMADEAKKKIVGAFIKMFFGAWLYNEITEKFTGRRAAFDPVDMAINDAKILSNEDMDLGDKIQAIVKDTSQELPFISGVTGGGRLPIQGAIPYSNPLEMVTKTFEDIGKLDDPEKRKTAINNLKKEWSKPVYYLLFPVAGGQVKKTVEGLSMYDKDLPIAGSYTNSGKLRFEADTSTLGKIQSAVFGQYASKNAREYFDKGYTPLTEKQINTVLDANMSVDEYRKYNQGIKEQGSTEDKINYISDLPISNEQKNVLANSTVSRKNKIDMENYDNYGSLDEFDYANNNPDKYLTIKNITDYDTFKGYKEDLTEIKKQYDNTNDRKQAVYQYINSLPLSVEQKLMLQKIGAGYSVKQYRKRLQNYINSLDLTKEEKESIDKVLFK